MTTTTTTTTRPVVERVRHPLVARRLAVVRTEDLSPTLRRVALGGPELAGFASHGPADHLKLVVPAEPGAELVMPVLEDERWVNRDAPGLVYRDYTVRTFRPDDGELVLELVVGDHGPASRWAATARVGDQVAVVGPRGSALPPLDRDHYVLATDETGVPALANWLDRLPPSARVTAIVEVGRPGDEVDLPSVSRTQVTWLYRGDAPAGTTTLLADAVGRALASRTEAAGAAGTAAGRGADGAPVADGVPGADGVPSSWWWAAGEASQVRAIRTMLTEAGVGRDSFAMTGYWRRGVENFDHHSPEA